MTTNTTSCQTNLRVEEKDKARNESLNRLILQHAEDMVYANEQLTYFHNVCAGLVLALVVSMVGTAYSMYYLSKGCDQPMQVAKVVKEKVKKGGEQYVLVP